MMGVGYNPKISTNGLVLAIDAGNVKSYPGSGTSWTDMALTSRIGTLTNSPTYSSTEGGTIVFNGTNLTYATFGSLGTRPTTGTISFWMKPTDVSNYRNPIGTNTDTASNIGFRWEMVTGGTFYFLSGNDAGTFGSLYNFTTTLTNNIWYMVTVTWDSSTSTLTGYLNGSQVFNSTTHTYWATNFSKFAVGAGFGLTTAARCFTGNISQCLMYNRNISATEVSQNFQSLRGRFGI